MLSLFNRWWAEEQIPAEHLYAQVVTIFKKGDTQKISNYRPISLLNIAYKLYASIIQKRLANHIDPMISRTQFGFRQNRCTTHALYVARRLQDISEQSGDTVIMTLLDWEKAFDRVAHPRLMEALERMNIPAKLRNVIAGLYSDPKFYVIHGQNGFNCKNTSSWYPPRMPAFAISICVGDDSHV